MAKLKGKRIKNVYKDLDRSKIYSLTEAIKLLKKAKSTKFDESVDIALNMSLDTRQSDQNIRGLVSLPNGTGKTTRIAVFARDVKADEAKKAGADIVGAEDLKEQIQSGKMDFDRLIATPDMMVLVGQLGKVLGPKGLMPNPKLGTVTQDVANAVKASKGGQVEYRAEKAGIIHAGIGKISFSDDALVANIKAYVSAIIKAKPSSVKGTYMEKVSISSTMGPSLKVKLADLN